MNQYHHLLLLLFTCLRIAQVHGHGMMVDPPNRSSAWRYGFPMPINYNDNELFCGGYTVQWDRNGGRCGVCGDPFDGERHNELPNGRFTEGLVVTAGYAQGADIRVTVTLTSNHKGYFTFKLCPATSLQREVSQACLDRGLLEVVNSRLRNHYELPHYGAGAFEVILRLPAGLTCDRCVLQWTYTAGNNWGICPDGSGQDGCGPQENFRNCADIRIWGGEGSEVTTPRPTTPRPTTPRPTTSRPPITTTTTTTMKPTTDDGGISQTICNSVPPYDSVGMDQWCKLNCARGYCPKSHCKCVQSTHFSSNYFSMFY